IFYSLLLLVLGVIGKVVGCGWGAKVTGFDKRQALQIGIGMVPRAEVSLIIANLGLQLALINQKEFSSAIVLVIGTTLITPPLLKWSFNKEIEAKGRS
ncbi:MAG: cation:proton antiporter, partial [Clostridia bacterium]|nr:cation:proton antiporter [Clostridia bacterium]